MNTSLDQYKKDLQVFIDEELEGRYKGWRKIFRICLVQGVWAVTVFRFGQWAYSLPKFVSVPFRFIYIVFSKIIEMATGIMLPVSCCAGGGLYIGHFGGIIINGGVVFGDNCKISHGVTIGTKGAGRGSDVPVIGNNVFIGAGAKLLGGIKIGDNVDIGANAVVIKNIPADVVAVGIPAEPIRKK